MITTGAHGAKKPKLVGDYHVTIKDDFVYVWTATKSIGHVQHQ